MCGCNKDSCHNYLISKPEQKQYQLEIKRVKKGPHTMWGLFALEDVEEGAQLCEYKGEIVTKKHGDMRGSFYDNQGLSYLFDMNDPEEKEKREEKIQQAYNYEFFPLCIDSMFFGNESRFINHSCDPNIQSFNLCGQVES